MLLVNSGSRFFKALPLILLLLLVSACSEEKPKYVNMQHRVELAVPTPPPAITYAYLPQYSHTVSFRRHDPLIRYLRRETGLNIRQVFPNTFDEHLKMVEQGKIDISFSNPLVYVRMADNHGAEAFARIVEPGGKAMFRGQIITRSDHPEISSIQDCRGKKWIAVDRDSAGGFLFDLGYFMDQGLQATDFSEISFAPGPGGKQEKVVLAVHAGKYDIGSIREGTLDVVRDKVDLSQIRVLAHTPWYPSWVYAARRNLDPKTRGLIAAALKRLDPSVPEHRVILAQAGIERIIPSTNTDFDSIRDLVNKISRGRHDKTLP